MMTQVNVGSSNDFAKHIFQPTQDSFILRANFLRTGFSASGNSRRRRFFDDENITISFSVSPV